MNSIIRKGIALASFTMAMSTGYSQLKVTAEIRPRAEYRHGYKTLPDSASNNAMFVDQRTRLTINYKKDRIAFKVALQDVRTWGSQKQLVGNEDFGLSVHEAWGLAKLNDNLSLKFGRQELVYDDHRILGSVGWAQQARSHDAVLFLFKKDKLKLHVGGAFNQDKPQLNTTSYTVGGSYKAMQYLWANYAFSDEFKASFLAMSVGQQVNFINQAGEDTYQDNYTLTTGTRLVYKKDKLGAALNGYYQLGSTNTWPANSVSAFNLGLNVSYQVTDPIKLTLGFEMLSGNSQTDTTVAYNKVQHAFTPFFGTNHKFNGYMDYFYVGSSHGNVGLQDTYLKLLYKKDSWSVGLDAHMFMTAADVLDPVELASSGNIRAMSSSLGTEIDFSVMKKLRKNVTLKAGYSHMLASETLATLKNVTYTTGADAGKGRTDQINNWGYVMIIFKPTFLVKEKEVK